MASGTSLPSTDGRQVDGDEVAVLGGALDTGEGAEAGPQVLQLGVDVLVAHLDGVDLIFSASRSGMVISGRMSTSAVNVEFFAVLDLGDLDVGLAERAAPRRW